ALNNGLTAWQVGRLLGLPRREVTRWVEAGRVPTPAAVAHDEAIARNDEAVLRLHEFTRNSVPWLVMRLRSTGRRTEAEAIEAVAAALGLPSDVVAAIARDPDLPLDPPGEPLAPGILEMPPAKALRAVEAHRKRLEAAVARTTAEVRATRAALDAEKVAGAGVLNAAGPVTGPASTSGLRKPHGSRMDETAFGRKLGGRPLSRATRSAMAEQLRAGGTLPAGPNEPSDLVGLWREAAAEYLDGVFDGPAASELRGRCPAAPRAPPAIVSRRLNRPVTGRRMGRSADAGHRFGPDGTLHVYTNDPAGVLHELVEALFAPWAGFTPQQAHTIAVLAERAVADPAHRYGVLLHSRAPPRLLLLTAACRAGTAT